MHRQVTIIAFALVAMSAPADAQPAAQCTATETQAECHARLRCKANEELEDCKKRLANAGGGARDDSRGDGSDRGAGGGDRGDRGDRNDRGDRGERGDRDRRDGGGRGNGGRDDDGDRYDGDDGGGGGGGRRGRRGGGGRSRGFSANKTFGLGLELGEPTGLTGKLFVSDSGALDFGIGYIYEHYYYGDGIHLYGDYLFHPTSLVSARSFELPLYIGVGLRYWDFDYCDNRICTYGGSAVGIRIPFGIAFDFNTAPLDIFLQLVPVIDFTRGDYYDRYGDRTHFGVDLSLGIRYWFK